MILLRFRDLTVPDGETVRRHKAIITRRGAVWWGWIMRQDETFPSDDIIKISAALEVSGPMEMLLYHSGSADFFAATVNRISAVPGGRRVRAPELDLTPAYMHESVCPAWFEFVALEPLTEDPALSVVRLPTLSHPSATDAGLVGGPPVDSQRLRNSGATMWEVRRL